MPIGWTIKMINLLKTTRLDQKHVYKYGHLLYYCFLPP